MSPFDAPKVDYNPLEKKDALNTKLEKDMPEKAWKGNEFKAKKDQALQVLKNLHLDSKVKETSKQEQLLKDKFKTHIDKEFKLLEHNYQKRLDKLGENKESLQARAALSRAADALIYRLEISVLQKGVESKDTKGSMAAKIRLIDNFTGVPGFGRHLIEGGGLTKQDLSAIFKKPLPKNAKEFGERMKTVLDNEGKLELGIKNLIKKSPKFTDVNNENPAWTKKRKHFSDIIWTSIKLSRKNDSRSISLAYPIGSNNADMLIDTVSRRFNVVMTKDGKSVDHYVDLMDQNKVFKPGKTFDSHLRYVCKKELGSKERAKQYNEGIDRKQEAQKTLHKELKEGIWYRSDQEVTGLSTLRNNPKLKKLIGNANNYEKKVSAEYKDLHKNLRIIKQMARVATMKMNDKVATEMRKIAKTMNPDHIKQSPNLRKPGSLRDIIQLIYSMIRGKDKDLKGLMDAGQDLLSGLNPNEVKKQAKDNYKKILKNAAPQPKLNDLLKLHSTHNEDSADGYFKKQAPLVSRRKDDPLNIRYRRERKSAIREHIVSILSIKEASGFKIGLGKSEMNLVYNKGGVERKFTIKTHADGKTVEITDASDPKNPKTVINNWAAINKAVDVKAKPKPKEAVKAKPTKAFPVKIDIQVAGAPVKVSFNPTTKQLIIKHPLSPVLFNEKGTRIGYTGEKGEYVFAEPKGGWKKENWNKLALKPKQIKQLTEKKKELLKAKPADTKDKTKEAPGKELQKKIDGLTVASSKVIRNKINRIPALKTLYKKFVKEFRGNKFKSTEWNKNGRVLKCRKAFLAKYQKNKQVISLLK